MANVNRLHKPPKPEKFSAETITLVKKILTEQLLEQVRIQAYEDAKKLSVQLKRGNFTHFFTRLNGILSTAGKENVRENFKARLESEIRGGSLFYMANGQKFFKVLVEQAPLPIDSFNISNELAPTRRIEFIPRRFFKGFNLSGISDELFPLCPQTCCRVGR